MYFKEKKAYILLGITIFINSIIFLIFWVPYLNNINPPEIIIYLVRILSFPLKHILKEDYSYIIYLFGIPLLVNFLILISGTTPLVQSIFECLFIKGRKFNNYENQRMEPLITEVINKINKKIGRNYSYSSFKYKILDDNSINAFAYGNKTLVINKGLLNLHDEEIKGILAHEFSHLLNKDSTFSICLMIGNLSIKILAIFGYIASWLTRNNNRKNNKEFPIIAWIIQLFSFIFVTVISKYIMLLFIRSYSRSVEKRCDLFAVELGYKEGLVSAFKDISDCEFGYNPTITEIFYGTHPKMSDRIAILENANPSIVQNSTSKNLIETKLVILSCIIAFYLGVFLQFSIYNSISNYIK
ncbi:M48 family metalloprotease [Cetobacterium sp. SF1]|uniref:M48 family metalloprotease n=1 Tax=Cetobacterium sp. SF1 TaxID=3417654 RepID=UPI003CFA3B85